MSAVRAKRIWPVSFLLVVLAVGPAVANGIGESSSFQFRSVNDKQVLLNLERMRMEVVGLLGVGSGGGLGGQTGNTTTIAVSGSNNTINVDQDHTGNQTSTDNSTDNSGN